MPVITDTPDPVRDAIKVINECGDLISLCLAKQLTRAVQAAAPINAIFWSDPRIGINGDALLQKLKEHIGLLATHFPERMNATLAGAGSGLAPNPDGTVTYTPPVIKEEQPE